MKPILDAFSKKQIEKDCSSYKQLGLYEDDDLYNVRWIELFGEIKDDLGITKKDGREIHANPPLRRLLQASVATPIPSLRGSRSEPWQSAVARKPSVFRGHHILFRLKNEIM